MSFVGFVDTGTFWGEKFTLEMIENEKGKPIDGKNLKLSENGAPQKNVLLLKSTT